MFFRGFLSILFLLPFANQLEAQSADTSYLIRLYDRCLDFAENKADSIRYYAGVIEQATAVTKFSRGKVFSLRLRGLAADLSFDYGKAIDYYLQSLEEARRLGDPAYEIAALSDLAIIYDHINQPENARLFYLKSLPLVRKSGELSSMLSTYNNLAVIYTHLGKYDSAKILLDECLSHETRMGGVVDFSSTYNNLGNIYFYQKRYPEALACFRRNFEKHQKEGSAEQLWIDRLNLADVFIETRQFDSAREYASRAMQMARELRSKSKEADSYALLAKLDERMGNFQRAYFNLKNWHQLDTALINAETNNTIANLQERYNAREREAENNLLLARVERQHSRNQQMTITAVALGALAILSALAYLTIRKANRSLASTNHMIVQQKAKLEELYHEKNALLSIVSHDLGAPFAGIRMWAQVLEADEGELNANQKKALSRIIESGEHGEKMIAHILDVERSDDARHKLSIEEVDLAGLVSRVADDFRASAETKKIDLRLNLPDHPVTLLTDALLFQRILENLLGNALKFTHSGKSVKLALYDQPDAVELQVSDEGIGILPEEIPRLFQKYSQISGKPTAGESSHGLGLSLVRRMVDDLNGTIRCSSEPGLGTCFTVRLTK